MESQGPRQRNPQPRVRFNEGWYYAMEAVFAAFDAVAANYKLK
jgi:hypothetical protein